MYNIRKNLSNFEKILWRMVRQTDREGQTGKSDIIGRCPTNVERPINLPFFQER